jgi:hypothetical protein
MGLLRKTLFIGTGGLSGVAGVRANSKKERSAKALEKQLALQERAAKEMRKAEKRARRASRAS